jgi:hypothetical protein
VQLAKQNINHLWALKWWPMELSEYSLALYPEEGDGIEA